MKGYSKNSKNTTDQEIEKLKESISVLGDISGIVVDHISKEIICGNQRASIIDINSCEIQIIQEFEEPDKFGTVQYGFVKWNGSLINFRSVIWKMEEVELANISSNLMYSRYDYFELAKNFTRDIMKASGFDSYDIKIAFGKEVFEKNTQKEKVPKQYIVVKFGPESKQIPIDEYKQFEENMMFNHDYNTNSIENFIKTKINDSTDKH